MFLVYAGWAGKSHQTINSRKCFLINSVRLSQSVGEREREGGRERERERERESDIDRELNSVSCNVKVSLLWLAFFYARKFITVCDCV